MSIVSNIKFSFRGDDDRRHSRYDSYNHNSNSSSSSCCCSTLLVIKMVTEFLSWNISKQIPANRKKNWNISATSTFLF